MCHIYNTVGSLKTIKEQLYQHNIHDFNSLNEVIEFKNQYAYNRVQIVSKHEYLINKEKDSLEIELPQLEISLQNDRQYFENELNEEIQNLKQISEELQSIPPIGIFQKVVTPFKQWFTDRKIRSKEYNFEAIINQQLQVSLNHYSEKCDRFQYITSDFRNAVLESSKNQIDEIDNKKSIIDGLNTFISGAIGENKVVKVLEGLNDGYYLINDFSISFSTALYQKQENQYIKSIQVDHILVSPAGIFLIETKNWSEKSIENIGLYSPVEQIKRSSFVLFKLLQSKTNSFRLLDRHHWGEKKVPIKSLIVLINSKPLQEFQYVKTLNINELIGYIKYFKPIFNNNEVSSIAAFLIELNEQKRVSV
jgi:hypothetical protein